MRKSFLFFLAVLMVLGLVSCSQNTIADMMGRMGGNIYGIKADLRVAEEASSEVRSSVSRNGDSYSVDLDRAKSIVGYVGEISDSPSKVSYLKESLNRPVSVSDAAAVRAAIREAVATVDVASKEGDSVVVKEMLATVGDAAESLDALMGRDDYVPSYADVVVVSVVSSLAESLQSKSDLELVSDAMGAVSTLIALTDIGELDLVGGVDLGVAMDNLMSMARSTSRAAGDRPVLSALKVPMRNLIELITDGDGKVSKARYHATVAQASALRAAYDVAVSQYVPRGSFADYLAEVPEIDESLGFQIEDVGRYEVCTFIVMLDRFNVIDGTWYSFVESYVNSNYKSLVNFGDYPFAQPVEGVDDRMLESGGEILNAASHLMDEAVGLDLMLYMGYDSDLFEDAVFLDKLYAIGIGLFINFVDIQILLGLDEFPDFTAVDSADAVQRTAAMFIYDLKDMFSNMTVMMVDSGYTSMFGIISKVMEKAVAKFGF